MVAALQANEDNVDRSYRARVGFAKNGSFNLALIPGEVVNPATPKAPVDDPQLTAQEVARQEGEARRVKAERERLGLKG